MTKARRVALAVALVVAGAVVVNPYLRGDGNGYYAYVRSAVIDHDLRFQNEFDRGDPAFFRATHRDGTHFSPSLTTRPGYIRNQWSVGAAVLWTPFFLVAHAFVKITGHWPADGYSFPYRWACAFATALYAAAGLFLARRVASSVTGRRAANVAVIAALGASSLAVYMFFLPFWALAVATLPASALVYLWHRGHTWAARRWTAYGALVGLATTIHPLGIAWLALLAVAWLGERGSARQRVIAGVASAAGFVVAELPQMVIRRIVHGSAFDTGYSVEWNFSRPPILRELFSAQHGLFTWTPITAVAVVGLVLLARRAMQRRLAVGLLVTFCVLLYLSAAYVTPEQSSFGNRMFVHFTPGFVVGLAVVAGEVAQRSRMALHIAVAALVTWNALFSFQWAWGLLPKRGPVNWAQMIRQQFTTAPREIGGVAVDFLTDRDALIREVQRRDEERLSRGEED